MREPRPSNEQRKWRGRQHVHPFPPKYLATGCKQWPADGQSEDEDCVAEDGHFARNVELGFDGEDAGDVGARDEGAGESDAAGDHGVQDAFG